MIVAYRIAKDTYGTAVRWKAYAADKCGLEHVIGHYPRRKDAKTAIDLLAGWRFVRKGSQWVRKEGRA